jgi:hypothetical protein
MKDKHLTDSNLDNPYQLAYKSGHSTKSAMLKIKSDTHGLLCKGQAAALTLLDLSAAFDTIDHDILLNRLSFLYGFTDTVLEWFTTYLSNRRQSVKVLNTLSSEDKLIYGVPQGSVLGPVLFTMYTAPLSKIISSYPNISHHLNADDTQINFGVTPRNFT